MTKNKMIFIIIALLGSNAIQADEWQRIIYQRELVDAQRQANDLKQQEIREEKFEYMQKNAPVVPGFTNTPLYVPPITIPSGNYYGR